MMRKDENAMDGQLAVVLNDDECVQDGASYSKSPFLETTIPFRLYSYSHSLYSF